MSVFGAVVGDKRTCSFTVVSIGFKEENIFVLTEKPLPGNGNVNVKQVLFKSVVQSVGVLIVFKAGGDLIVFRVELIEVEVIASGLIIIKVMSEENFSSKTEVFSRFYCK